MSFQKKNNNNNNNCRDFYSIIIFQTVSYHYGCDDDSYHYGDDSYHCGDDGDGDDGDYSYRATFGAHYRSDVVTGR